MPVIDERLLALLSHPVTRTLGWVLGTLFAAFVVERVLYRAMRRLARKTETDIDDQIIEVLNRPIFFSVILVGISVGARTLQLGASAAFVVSALVKTCAILIWGFAVVRIGRVVLSAVSRRAEAGSLVQNRTVPLFDILSKVAVVSIAIYMMLVVWNIDITAWLASAGVAGIAVGFAAKDTLANLFAGIFILADAPYKVGDFIVLDESTAGQVVNIGIRSTRILTRDDVEVTIPNAVIGGSKIVNQSGGPHVKTRIRIEVSAAYGSDIDLVASTLLECKNEVPNVAAQPAPKVHFRRFGGSGLEFELLVWVDDPFEQEVTRSTLNSKVYKAFARAGIEIPYNKHDVYIKQMPTAPPAA